MNSSLIVQMRRSGKAFAAMALALTLTCPALAQEEKPVSQREPDVGNVASTPADDLNLSKEDIPDVLLRAVADPYDRTGLRSCLHLAQAVEELDAVLGADFDTYSGDQRRVSAGHIAKSAVGSLIPFRGIVRELTGAARNQRDFEEAVMAGAVRRGYLKGVGEEMGCPPPARPADPAIRAANAAGRKSEEKQD